MKANTALWFVAMGAALILANRDDGRSRRIAVGLGGSAGVVAAVIGAQYLAGANFGVDELLFREPPGAVGTVHPGRMSPQTAMSFVIIAACLMLAPRPRWRRLVIALATIPAALGAMNVLDFTFGGDAPSFLATYSQMALPTAATFLVLSVGVLGLMGARDPLAVFRGHGEVPRLSGRLLRVAIVVPICVNEVLDIARIETGKLSLSSEPVTSEVPSTRRWRWWLHWPPSAGLRSAPTRIRAPASCWPTASASSRSC
ncbi:MAG: hypothetical protein ACR2JZ_05315 [Candidatus Limnocylindrales bacterium]